MQNRLEDTDWELLLDRISEGKCTPFLGAGASHGVLPLGSDIAKEWAKAHGYPLDDDSDLASVAQFLAVKYDPIRPKDMLIRRFANLPQLPDFSNPYEPHRLLADLPLPVYITTNYDDFMIQALRQAEYAPGFKKAPAREVCRWNHQLVKSLRNKPSVLKSSKSPKVSVQTPVVFHLHGHTELAESMVLTEDDYLDFLVAISKDEDVLPSRIQQAMAGTSLLFLGYRLSDWSFRVLFRSVVGYLELSQVRAHVSVQLNPLKDTAPDEQRQKAQDYLHRYFGDLKIRVYWGKAEKFAEELRDRWEAYNGK